MSAEQQAKASAPAVRARGPVRITLPAAVAYDPDRLKRSIASVLERIGCPSCFSGANCLLEMERDLVVNEELRVSRLERVLEPSPQPWKEAHQITLGLSAGVKYDIDKVFQAIDRAIDLLGPHPCISGFDVLVRDELRTIVVNEQLEAQRFGQRF